MKLVVDARGVQYVEPAPELDSSEEAEFAAHPHQIISTDVISARRDKKYVTICKRTLGFLPMRNPSRTTFKWRVRHLVLLTGLCGKDGKAADAWRRAVFEACSFFV